MPATLTNIDLCASISMKTVLFKIDNSSDTRRDDNPKILTSHERLRNVIVFN